MKQYYQGEDMPFSIDFFSEFQNVESFSEFSEIRAYAYTDGCLIQKFATLSKSGYSAITLSNNVLSGIIESEYSSLFAPGAIIVEIVGIKQNSALTYDIGKKTIGSLKKSIIKREKLEGEITLLLSKNSIQFEESVSIESIVVTITGTENKSYSIVGLPSWLSVTNKTETGFTLHATENTFNSERTATVTVKLNNYPAVQETIQVNQEAAETYNIHAVYNTPSGYVSSCAMVINAPAGESVVIDWGDGSGNTAIAGSGSMTAVPHTFLTAGNKTVKIKGALTRISFNKTGEEPDPVDCNVVDLTLFESDTITSINYLVAGQTDFAFSSDAFKFNLPEAVSAKGTFQGCTVFGSVPGLMFSLCAKLENFSNTFQGSGIIEAKSALFAGTNAKNFRQAFFGCSNLNVIGEDLFKSVKTSLENSFINGGSGGGKNIIFLETFKLCTGLQSVPAALFDNLNIYRLSLHGCFNNCISITNVPDFYSCQLSDLQMCFYKCQSLTDLPDNYLENIVFSDMNFILMDGAFGACHNLDKNIDTLFSNNIMSKIATVGFYGINYGLFDGKDGGDGEPPALIQTMKIESSDIKNWTDRLTGLTTGGNDTHCFRGCVPAKLGNYDILDSKFK